MRRILMVVVMVALLALTAVPAFAVWNCTDTPNGENCGGGGPGGGAHTRTSPGYDTLIPNEVNGGGVFGDGGAGVHYAYTLEDPTGTQTSGVLNGGGTNIPDGRLQFGLPGTHSPLYPGCTPNQTVCDSAAAS
jgi:opacity protein-like surface antigen